jgi:hypothetical protein
MVACWAVRPLGVFSAASVAGGGVEAERVQAPMSKAEPISNTTIAFDKR